MPQYIANFSQRGAVVQHLGRQRMAKLMRTIGRCLDAGACEVLLDHVCDTRRTTKPADGCCGPQKDMTSAAPWPSAPQVRRDCGADVRR